MTELTNDGFDIIDPEQEKKPTGDAVADKLTQVEKKVVENPILNLVMGKGSALPANADVVRYGSQLVQQIMANPTISVNALTKNLRVTKEYVIKLLAEPYVIEALQFYQTQMEQSWYVNIMQVFADKAVHGDHKAAQLILTAMGKMQRDPSKASGPQVNVLVNNGGDYSKKIRDVDVEQK